MKYEYVFAENGLVAYKAGELIGKEVISFQYKNLIKLSMLLIKIII